MDIDGIEPGVDFVKALDEQVAQASAFIAVIGPGWTDLKNAEGQRRLDQPNDHVRIEIESALKRDIRVIPVLVDGARMPTENELPDSLKSLSRRNAVMLSHHRFGPEVDDLARALQRALRLQPKSTAIYAFATGETPTTSWIDFLFSFEGRISRKSYWLSGLAILGVCLFFLLAISALLGKQALDPQFSNTLNNVYTIATLPLYWPSFALYLKRVHDFGQGQLWALPLLVLAGFIFGLSAAGYDMAASLAFPVILVVLIVVGSIKGTPGPNQYGPDPLANTARKSAM